MESCYLSVLGLWYTATRVVEKRIIAILAIMVPVQVIIEPNKEDIALNIV